MNESVKTNYGENLSRLYALRAGLSEISVRKDSVISLSANKENADKELSELDKKHKNELLHKSKKLKNAEDELDNFASKAEELTADIKKGRGRIVVSVFLLIAALVLAVLFWFLESNVSDWMIVPALIFSAGVVVCVIRLKDVVSGRSRAKKNLEDLPKKKKQLERNISKFRTEAQKASENYKSWDSEKVSREENIQSMSVKIGNDIATCGVLSEALVSSFCDILDPRDWKNLDLVIFYLETGRADSVKEALQLVDRQAQTDQIVGAIHNVGVMISDTIKSGMRELQVNLVRCFSVLSDRMDAIAEKQLGAIAGLSAQVSSFSKSLEAKANVPSSQLAEDMRYMRTLAENSEIRRRNGM